MCSGHLFVCSCRSTVKSSGAENSTQSRLLLCLRREETRRVHFARPPTQASEPALTASCLAEKRRADALHNKQASEPRTGCWCCVYSRVIRSHERRALGALLFLVSVRARVDRQLFIVVVWLWRGAASAFAHRGCIRNPTRGYLHLCVPRASTAACCVNQVLPS